MKYSGALLLAVGMLLSGSVSHGTALGERVGASGAQSKAQVESSQIKVTQKNSTTGAPYSIRESQQGARVMKEYVDSQDVVFAISWSGRGRPNFSEIFGDYYRDYQTEALSPLKPKSRKILRVKTERIVVENFGHGSIISGFAYVPSLLPAGIAIEDLR